MLELSVLFTSTETDPESPIRVSLFRPDSGARTDPVDFTPPIGDDELADLRWYLEVFSTWPTGPDYDRARRIETRFEEWGRVLLNSVIEQTAAARLWQQFSDAIDQNKLVTIDATDPRVLRLPWELLADSGGHLFSRRISVRRRLREEVTAAAQRSFELPVRILVVVARPDGAGFISPREVSLPLLNALDALGDRVTTEFLYPPTLKALSDRLDDETAPPVHVVHFDGHGVYDSQLGLGYLLFEDENHQMARVDSNRLGTLLNNCGVPLIVLNACQSGAQEETNPYASVAARLVRAGAGSVLAMNYSVLVVAARMFVEAFYGSLADGLPVGRAVDRGRRALMADTRRHSLTRHDASGQLVEQHVELQDWFLPALYQQAQDPVVFPKADAATVVQPKSLPRALTDPAFPGALPAEPLHGFHGRARELLTLERELADHAVVVVHGFGGLGKTALAAEAGRWFYRMGRFPGGAAFVSFEHGGSLQQLCSWVGQAVSGDPDFVLGDGDPVQRIAALLRQTPALVILDNFESVLGREPLMPPDELRAVLDAVWLWAQAGIGTKTGKTGTWGSRVLITTRDTTFNDARFTPSKGCAHLALEGLSMPDALELAADILDNLGIDRAAIPRLGLVSLMDHLGGHALSLYLVLPHLRNHSPAELIRDFENLLPGFTSGQAKERNESLLVSLEFSLRRLGDETRLALPALGVFQGVCFEDDMLVITEIDPEVWQSARAELESAALLQVERIPGVEPPFLKFHPTLLPYLEKLLPDDRRTVLQNRYWRRYYAVANYLYKTDTQNPYQARAIAARDMPNLRHGFDLAVRAGEAGEEDPFSAVDFADSINKFLNYFGRRRERDLIRAQIDRLSVSGDGRLTRAEYLRQSQAIDALLQQGRGLEAEQMCRSLLARIEAGAAYDIDYDLASTLTRLSRCIKSQGRPSEALPLLQRALGLFEQVSQQSPDARKMVGMVHTELADLYRLFGQYDEAREEYQKALAIDQELSDLRGMGVDLGQLGTLAMEQNDLEEARRRYTEALNTFQTLGEPTMEAVSWHQLGMLAEAEKNWEEAERCYRISLQIKEAQNDLPGVARTANQLASAAMGAGRPEDAERWYLRAQEIKDVVAPQDDTTLQNLALFYLERDQLDDARRYAERAVAIVEKQDLSVEPWKNYGLMAEIARRQGRTEEMAAWRRRAYSAQDGFAGTRRDVTRLLSQFRGPIAGVVAACEGNESAREQIKAQFESFQQNHWMISDPIRRIWAGERNPEALTADLDYQDRAIVLAMLHRLGVAVPPIIAECMALAEATPDPRIAELLENFEPLIAGVVAGCAGDEMAKTQINPVLDSMVQNGWQIAGPIRRIWAGERNRDALTAGLDIQDTAIITAILARLEGGGTPSQPAPAAPSAPPSNGDPVARVREQWKDVIPAVVAASQGNIQAAQALTPFLNELGQMDDWRALIGVLRRIIGGERDAANLLTGLDATDTIVAGDVLRALGVVVGGPDVAAPDVGTPGSDGSQTADQQGLSLDQLLNMVKLACSAGAPPGLSEIVHMVTHQMANDANAPGEVRALGRVLNRILSGDRMPDLSALPDELAAPVRALLQSLG